MSCRKTSVGQEWAPSEVLAISSAFLLIREYEDYAISESALGDPTFRDELIALGLDPETGRGKGTLSAFEIDFERNTSSQPLNPRQGYSIAGHVESAGTLLGGSFTYNEVLGEVRTYLEITPNSCGRTAFDPVRLPGPTRPRFLFTSGIS